MEQIIYKRRIAYIDNLKGIAIILVIVGHIIQKIIRFDYYPKSNEILELSFEIIYSFHMTLFMVISGFLFDYSYACDKSANKSSIKERILNLFFCYLLFSLLEGLIKIRFSQSVITPVTYKDIFLIIFQPIGGRMWFIYVLIEYYLLFSLRFIKDNIGKPLLLFMVSLISFSNVLFDYSWWFSVRRATRDLLPFYVGILLSRYGTDRVIKNKYLRILSILVVVIRVSLYFIGVSENEIPIVSVLYGLVISLGIFSLFEKENEKFCRNWLGRIGKRALELYFFQEYPLTIATIIIPKIITDVWVAITLCIIFTIICIVILGVLLRKCRIYGFLFKPYSTSKRVIQLIQREH